MRQDLSAFVAKLYLLVKVCQEVILNAEGNALFSSKKIKLENYPGKQENKNLFFSSLMSFLVFMKISIQNKKLK